MAFLSFDADAETVADKIMQSDALVTIINRLGTYYPFAAGSRDYHERISEMLAVELDDDGRQFLKAISAWFNTEFPHCDVT